MMKIALAQTNIIWENKKKNIDHLKEILSLSNMKDCEMILLPEMSFTGFSMNTELTGDECFETKEAIRALCIEHHMAIGFGWVKNKQSSENHYTIMDKHGDEFSDYVKIHPFSYSGEDKHFVSGNEIKTFELNGIVFSSLICYDLRFPELFRIASKKAHVIIVPANWPSKRDEHWITLIRARAIENQIYIIGINCVGDIGNISYCGNSCIVAPDGAVKAISRGTESIIQYELLDNVQQYRDSFPTYRDRKDNLYLELQRNEKT